MWFIGVEVEQGTSAPPPKKNPGFTIGSHSKANKEKNNIEGYMCILWMIVHEDTYLKSILLCTLVG